jgi:RNA polymerase sigma-70 factor, ECF subfamily
VIHQRNAQSLASQGTLRLDWAAQVKDPVDRELVSKAVAGCASAFAVLLETHYDAVYRMAWRWLGEREAAEDAAQEVCVKLAGVIRTFRGEAEFSTWLYRVTYNVVIDEIRARERALRFDRPDVVVLHQAQAAPSPEAAALDSELWCEVRDLPPQQRDAVLLVYAEDLSHAEAATVMGCTERTVSWHLHAARKRLRARLQAVG